MPSGVIVVASEHSATACGQTASPATRRFVEWRSKASRIVVTRWRWL